MSDRGLFAYASAHGHAFIDRALYLPAAWTRIRRAMTASGVPSDTEIATKPPGAHHQPGAGAGVAVGWVTGDEMYGEDPSCGGSGRKRTWLRAGRVPRPPRQHREVGTRARSRSPPVSRSARGQRLSAGTGAKGPRVHDWAQVALVGDGPGQHRLLLRRNRSTGETAYYRTWTPAPVKLVRLVTVAGTRWADRRGLPEPRRSWPRWINIRSAPGPPGTAGPLWPCSRTRSSAFSPPPSSPSTTH